VAASFQERSLREIGIAQEAIYSGHVWGNKAAKKIEGFGTE
jgi:hypothetical protein